MKFRTILIFSLCLFVLFTTQQKANAENGYIELSDISHNISSNGLLLYRINAEKGYIKDFSSDEFVLDKISVLWFEDNKASIKITSEKGVLNKKTGNVSLNKNVKAVSDDYQIFCNSLFYDNKKKLIYLEGNIKLVSETGVMYADKGKIDTLTKIMTLTHNVRGKLL